jgi:hypothetical protein
MEYIFLKVFVETQDWLHASLLRRPLHNKTYHIEKTFVAQMCAQKLFTAENRVIKLLNTSERHFIPPWHLKTCFTSYVLTHISFSLYCPVSVSYDYYYRSFIYHGATVLSRPRPPLYRGFTVTLRHTTFVRIPLDEWSARRRDLYLTKHNNHRDRHSLLLRYSNPQSQQASGRRPTP